MRAINNLLVASDNTRGSRAFCNIVGPFEEDYVRSAFTVEHIIVHPDQRRLGTAAKHLVTGNP
ncbi:MAG TPA: hypothetical protein VLM42_11945, partial [Bryobacteraceae bacterium]|nr:hypothetical protein [Bryobacteraceae bacterium]